MIEEQLTSKMLSIVHDITAIDERVKFVYKRIGENDVLTVQIHKLAASVEALVY